MNLVQEMAALIRHIVDASGVSASYYGTQPQGFVYPSVYFPVPDMEQRQDTLQQFQLYFTFYVQFFARTAEDAGRRANAAVRYIARRQNCIELFNEDGTPSGKYMNIADMFSRKVADEPGIVQLTVSFVHRESYNRPRMERPIKGVILDMTLKDALEEASHLVSRFPMETHDERSK